MAIWYVCQWGFWGENPEEACGEADEDLEGLDGVDEAHEHCGYYVFRAVDDMAKELIESVEVADT